MFKKREIKTNMLKLENQNQTNIKQPQPRKIQKLDIMKTSTIAASTSVQKKIIQEQAKQQLDELNYKGTNALHQTEDIAVMANQTQTEVQKDARSKAIQAIQTTKKIKQGALQKGIYRGLNGYANYTLNQQIAQNSKFKGNFGPLRAPTNIRVTSRMDHNPELCKDWFVSGYCVFGNSCIYIHDRYDYKSGFELDKDFEKQQRQRWRRINDSSYQQKPEYQQKLQQFKVDEQCKKCCKKFQEPKIVSCGHIYCSKCASKLNKCMICNKALTGIMNNAQAQLQKKRTLYQQMKRNFENQANNKKLQRKRWKNQNSQSVFE